MFDRLVTAQRHERGQQSLYIVLNFTILYR